MVVSRELLAGREGRGEVGMFIISHADCVFICFASGPTSLELCVEPHTPKGQNAGQLQ